MRKTMTFLNKGSLVKMKYASNPIYGIATSKIEYHARNNGAYVWEYVWVLWDDGEHNLVKVEYLEVINE